jgi:rRNA maturation protein Nop10
LDSDDAPPLTAPLWGKSHPLVQSKTPANEIDIADGLVDYCHEGKFRREDMILKTTCQHCGHRFEVDIEAEGRTAFCPQCGKETALSVPPPRPAFTPPGNIKHGWAYVLLGCAVVIGLSYLFADSLGSSGQSNDSALVSVSEVKGEILTYDGMNISGLIKNLSKAPLEAVSVNYSVFDERGNKLGDAIDFVSQIGVGETWKFKAITLKDGCESYRLESIVSRVDGTFYKLQFKKE